MRRPWLRALAGAVIGFVAGGVLVAVVVLTKFGPLVDTPRSWHGAILAGSFAAPTLIGGLVGLAWRRGRRSNTSGAGRVDSS